MARQERLRLGALAAACAALWAGYLYLAVPGLFHDPLWYLEPARHFARGEGIVTNILYPAQLAQLRSPVGMPAPFLLHGPAAIAVLGAAFRLFGVTVPVALAVAYGELLGVGVLLYAFARRAAGPAAALLATALLWTDMMVVRRNYAALTDPLFMLFVMAGLYFLWRSADERPAAFSFAAGVFLGLASMTRLAGQAYWLGFLACAVWLAPRDLRRPAALLAGLLLALIPLFIFNERAAGKLLYSPGYYLLAWSRSFPGFRSATTFMPLSSGAVLVRYPADIAAKLITGPLYAVNRLLEESGAPYAMALALLGLLARPKTAGERRARAFAWCLLVPVLLVNCVVSYGAVDYLQPLFPLLFVPGAAFALSFSRENLPARGPRRAAAVLAALAVFLSPAALAFNRARKERPKLARFAEQQAALGRFVAARVKPGEIVYSDDPALVAWHADRGCVMLTATLDDATAAFAKLAPDALLITSARASSEDFDPAWADALREGKPVLGFSECERFEDGDYRAVLYRRAGACPAAARGDRS